MILTIDTSALSRVLAADELQLQVIARRDFESFIIPLAADAELRFGFRNGTKEQQNLELYDEFCQKFGFDVLCPDQETSKLYAELAGYCRQKGISLSHNDLWIAATTQQHNAQLLTLDADFSHLPQIRKV